MIFFIVIIRILPVILIDKYFYLKSFLKTTADVYSSWTDASCSRLICSTTMWKTTLALAVSVAVV